MNPRSQQILAQIVNPQGPSSPPEAAAPASTFPLAQVVAPTGGYTGPERRAPQVIVAEVVEEAAPVAVQLDAPAR